MSRKRTLIGSWTSTPDRWPFSAGASAQISNESMMLRSTQRTSQDDVEERARNARVKYWVHCQLWLLYAVTRRSRRVRSDARTLATGSSFHGHAATPHCTFMSHNLDWDQADPPSSDTASKFAVAGLTKCLCASYASQGIRVNGGEKTCLISHGAAKRLKTLSRTWCD